MTHHDDDSRPDAVEATGARPVEPVDCRKLAHLLGDYVDDALPQETKAAVDGHMHQCAPCMAFLKQYKFAPEAVRALLLKAVPHDLEDRLLSFLRSRCHHKAANKDEA